MYSVYTAIMRLCGFESTGKSVSCEYVFYCVFFSKIPRSGASATYLQPQEVQLDEERRL